MSVDNSLDQYQRSIKFQSLIYEGHTVYAWLSTILSMDLKPYYTHYILGTSAFVRCKSPTSVRMECKFMPVSASSICNGMSLKIIDGSKGVLHELDIPFSSVFKDNPKIRMCFDGDFCQWSEPVSLNDMNALVQAINAYLDIWYTSMASK